MYLTSGGEAERATLATRFEPIRHRVRDDVFQVVSGGRVKRAAAGDDDKPGAHLLSEDGWDRQVRLDVAA